ncbi:Hypothetical predicted protein [Lecanosticta acicola]|uniref:Ubiquitin-like domain-containing protein n=1 Tax=Lecanosticta acicola TaxID=111012 RepID=A0AAI8YT87_9PEZI|nr:Hypothetical predicted protein [Lecanosticta acicola]
MPLAVINGNGLPLPASRRRSRSKPDVDVHVVHAPAPPPPSSSAPSAPPNANPPSSHNLKRPAPADTTRKHSATFTVTSGSERVVHVYPDRTDRTSSGGSASVRSPLSSGGSRTPSSEESWSEVEYEDEDEEEIGPSDSASRSRHPPPSRRHTVEAPGAPSRRHSSRRESARPERQEAPPRRHSSRRHHTSRHDDRHDRHDRHDSHSRHARSSSRRVGSDESSSTVASADDYPYGHPTMSHLPYPPRRGYSQAQPHSHAGYPPSMTSGSHYHDPYAPPHQALVRMPPDPFGYPRQSNPFSAHPQEQNPFSPVTEASSYFATDPMGPPAAPRHHPPRPEGPPRPQSFAAPSAGWGSEVMAPYHGGMPPYGGHYGMPGYPPYPPPMHWPPSAGSSPPPKDDKVDHMEAIKELIKKRDADDEKGEKEKQSEINSLKELIKKHEEEAIARQKAWIAEREAEAAARAAEKAKAEAEERRKQEIDDARKKAKEDAEKKAEEAAKKAQEEHEKKLAEAAKAKEEADKAAEEAAKKAQEEHEKKLAEAEKAKEEADKAKKELEDEIAKSKPTPDSLKAPIKFKDALGRTFRFPWHLCKTWKGMETLIKQAFMHIDGIGDHVHQGHYDLLGPDGEIILPQVWDTMIQPDTEISMHMWPMDEPKEEKPEPLIDPFSNLGLGDFPGGGGFGMLPPEGPLPKKKGSKKEKDGKKKAKGGGGSPDMMFAGMMPPPPPPPPGHHAGGAGTKDAWPDPFAGMNVSIVPEKPSKASDKTKARTKSRSGKEISPLAAWFAGGSLNAKPPRKR